MSLKCGLVRYAAFRSLRSTTKFVSLSTFLFILTISLSMSPCLERNLYAILASSSKLSSGGGNTKSSSVGILISGSNVSSPSVTPISILSIGGGWKIFLFCYSNIFLFSFMFLINVLPLSISSPCSPDGVEESILLGIKGFVFD